MPRAANQKLKPLYLAKILTERTDENNPLTAVELIAALKRYGISSERKAVYDDIEALREYGFDIVLRRGKNGGYYLASRDFELAELKLLVDAVQSSRFITGKRSEELIGKLSKLASAPQAKELNRQVYVAGRAKTQTNTVYYSIDAIHTAINEHRKISFRYFDYNTRKRREYRKDGASYTRTPVALCWSDDKYYVITYRPEKTGDPFAQFRVDRMDGVEVLDEPADAFDRKGFNVAEHAKRLFGMYSGQTVTAALSLDKTLVGAVLDHFGTGTVMTPAGIDRFTITVEVSESPVFLAWVLQFGKKAEILSPNSLREAMRKLLDDAGSVYSERRL
jgi:predicted DNA-binding transcriptional regulator YafY